MSHYRTFLKSGNFIVVNKILANRLGIENVILLSGLLSIEEYRAKLDLVDEDGWFKASAEDIFEETTFGRKKQDKTINFLIQSQIIETKLQGVPATKHFRLCADFDGLINDIITNWSKMNYSKNGVVQDQDAKDYDLDRRIPVCPKVATQIDPNGQTDMSQTDKLIIRTRQVTKQTTKVEEVVVDFLDKDLPLQYRELNFTNKLINSYFERFGEERMKIVMVEYHEKKSKVKNIPAWISSALKDFDLSHQELKLKISLEAQKQSIQEQERIKQEQIHIEEKRRLEMESMSKIKNWITTHQIEYEQCIKKALEKIEQIKPIYQAVINKAKQTGQELVEVIKENTVYSSWVFDEIKAVMV